MSTDLQKLRTEAEREYRVSRGMIKNPGKFEGQPVYAVVLWDLMLEGAQDEIVDGPDGTYDAFRVDQNLVEAFPEDFDEDDIGSWVVLSQSDTGFVNTELMTADEFNDFTDSDADADNDDGFVD